MKADYESPKYPEHIHGFSYYRYFSDAGNRPVLLAMNAQHRSIDAFSLDVESNSFESDYPQRRRCETDWQYDEVDEATFNGLIELQRARYYEHARKLRASRPWAEVAKVTADPNRVVLQNRGSWIVDARFFKQDCLCFCSGDAHHEYCFHIHRTQFETLRTALRDELGPVTPGTLLDLIKLRFSVPESAPNPFNEIRDFLDRSGITVAFW